MNNECEVLSVAIAPTAVHADVRLNGVVVRGFALRFGRRGQFLNLPSRWDKEASGWRTVVELTDEQRRVVTDSIIDRASRERLATGFGIVYS